MRQSIVIIVLLGLFATACQPVTPIAGVATDSTAVAETDAAMASDTTSTAEAAPSDAVTAQGELAEEEITEAAVNENANLRAGPGTDYNHIGSALAGTVVDVVATNTAGDWYQLASGEWIAGFLVTNAPSELPVAEALANTGPRARGAAPDAAADTAPAENASTAAPPGILADMLAAHNAIRAEVGLPPLVWDTDLAAASQSWSAGMAGNCQLVHATPIPNVFENISQQSNGTSAADVANSPVFGWASTNERSTYAATNGCPLSDPQFGSCGHYRNIIDPELTKLGCGMVPGCGWDFWTCRLTN